MKSKQKKIKIPKWVKEVDLSQLKKGVIILRENAKNPS